MLPIVSPWIGAAAKWYAIIYGLRRNKTVTSWSIWKIFSERHWFMLSEENRYGCQCNCIGRNLDGYFVWCDWNICISCNMFGLLLSEKVNIFVFFSNNLKKWNWIFFLVLDTEINQSNCWATAKIHRQNHSPRDQEHRYYTQSRFMGHFNDFSCLAVFKMYLE